MLKLTKTGIGLLTKQYRSVLRKCLLLNFGLLFILPNKVEAVEIGSYARSDAAVLPTTGFGWDDRGYQDYVVANVSRNYVVDGNSWYNVSSSLNYQTISSSKTIIQNLEALDVVIGSYPIWGNNSVIKNKSFLASARRNNTALNSIDSYGTIIGNLIALDYTLGTLPSGIYVSNLQSMGDNVKALDTAIGAKIASDGHYIKKSNTNSITANLSALDYALYNYYYTFRVDESKEVTDSASFFQKDFSTLQEVDLHIKNPTHLGAFTKCDEACPRPLERFSLSLSQEQMLKNDASVDAGTSRHCLRQFGDVLANLLKNMASKYAKMNDFMNVEVCHA